MTDKPVQDLFDAKVVPISYATLRWRVGHGDCYVCGHHCVVVFPESLDRAPLQCGQCGYWSMACVDGKWPWEVVDE
jgi:hypothetical protein